MSRIYKIEWAQVAENDLRDIIAYIAMDSPSSALAILRKIKQASSKLRKLPERGRVVPELLNQGILIYREIIVPPWRRIYRLSDKCVFVLSVLDSRRNVEDILLKRLVEG